MSKGVPVHMVDFKKRGMACLTQGWRVYTSGWRKVTCKRCLKLKRKK